MRGNSRFESLWGAFPAAALTLALSACGGGGGGSGGGGGFAMPQAAPAGAASMKASCTNCAAVDDHTYAGSGTGIWQGFNASTVATDMPISITGLNGQTVSLVFTNEGASREAMPGLVLRSNSQVGVAANKSMAGSNQADTFNAEISEFNRSGFAKLMGPLSKSAVPISKSMAPSATYVLNDVRTIFLYDHTQRTVRLASQRAASDGTTINTWVETSELDPSRVSSALAVRMQDKFAAPGGIYDMLVRVGGPLWGDHQHTELISSTAQPVDIFFVNFEPNGKPYGLVGYFWGLNNFRKGANELTYSNESLGLYLDSESLYLDGEAGVKQIATAMAHEGMHMQNFYRRGVKLGGNFTFDTWLEEMTALMMEDWASFGIDPTHNAIRDSRYPYYLNYNGAGSYNCALTDWTPMGAACESYAVNGSFGGFLNRQLGLDFYKTLLASSGSMKSADLLDGAIKAARPGSSLGQELRHFTAASGGLIPLGAGITEYSMPARSEGGFNLPAIDPLGVGHATRRLPQAVPDYLNALASFPVIRPGVSGTYSETVRVPAGSTLSVVIN